MADFDLAIQYVLQNEGGLVDNRKDKGGITQYGITIPMLTAFRSRQCTPQDIVTLTQAEAKQLYEALFWTPLKVSGLKQAIATAILDTAVNQGQMTAVKLAQHVLGYHVLADGLMGPETLKALDVIDEKVFIYNYLELLQDRFVDFCVNATNQLVFLKGWLRRSRRLMSLL
jgi:lysozyme family protein